MTKSVCNQYDLVMVDLLTEIYVNQCYADDALKKNHGFTEFITGDCLPIS